MQWEIISMKSWILMHHFHEIMNHESFHRGVMFGHCAPRGRVRWEARGTMCGICVVLLFAGACCAERCCTVADAVGGEGAICVVSLAGRQASRAGPRPEVLRMCGMPWGTLAGAHMAAYSAYRDHRTSVNVCLWHCTHARQYTPQGV